MPLPKLDEFFSDPKHKETRDFLSGVVDARIKELIEERKRHRSQQGGEPREQNTETAGNIFDELFGE